MSYRCEVCREHVAHGKSVRRFIQYRADNSIQREWKICDGCRAELMGGKRFHDLLMKHRISVEVVSVTPRPMTRSQTKGAAR